MVRVGARPPQVDPVRQRGDRLRHPRHDPGTGSNHHGASMVVDATRDADRRRDAVERGDLRHRSARADRPRRRDRSRSQSFPDDTSLGIGSSSLQNELRMSQDSLRDAVGGNRRLRRRQPERLLGAFDRIVAGQQLVLRARLLPARPRPGPQPQHRGARHAAQRRPSARARATSTPKKPAASIDREQNDRRRPRCARRSTARCRSAA